MKLVRISETTFVNPERIDAIESSTNMSIIIQGVPYTVSQDYTTLITNLMKAGVEFNTQFFSG